MAEDLHCDSDGTSYGPTQHTTSSLDQHLSRERGTYLLKKSYLPTEEEFRTEKKRARNLLGGKDTQAGYGKKRQLLPRHTLKLLLDFFSVNEVDARPSILSITSLSSRVISRVR